MNAEAGLQGVLHNCMILLLIWEVCDGAYPTPFLLHYLYKAGKDAKRSHQR